MNDFLNNVEKNLKTHLNNLSQNDNQNDKQSNGEYNPIKEVSSFRLPIQYLKATDIHELPANVKNDLELVENSTNKDKKSMYDYLFMPSNAFGKNLIPQWSNQFTNNTDFLKDTNDIISSWSEFSKDNEYDNNNKIDFLNAWKMVKKDSSFLEKYSFIDWEPIKHLNKYPEILQILTILNISSPVLSLLLPIMFLVIPFFLLKLQRVPITFSAYIRFSKT